MKVRSILAIVILSAVLLTGCSTSPKYDFSDTDLSDDIVCIIRLSQTGNIRSEYNILGIQIGESKSSAESIGKAYFGEDGTWQKIAGIESVSYGSDTSDEGILTIIFDPQTNKVSSVNYHKTPND